MSYEAAIALLTEKALKVTVGSDMPYYTVNGDIGLSSLPEKITLSEPATVGDVILLQPSSVGAVAQIVRITTVTPARNLLRLSEVYVPDILATGFRPRIAWGRRAVAVGKPVLCVLAYALDDGVMCYHSIYAARIPSSGDSLIVAGNDALFMVRNIRIATRTVEHLGDPEFPVSAIFIDIHSTYGIETFDHTRVNMRTAIVGELLVPKDEHDSVDISVVDHIGSVSSDNDGTENVRPVVCANVGDGEVDQPVAEPVVLAPSANINTEPREPESLVMATVDAVEPSVTQDGGSDYAERIDDYVSSVQESIEPGQVVPDTVIARLALDLPQHESYLEKLVGAVESTKQIPAIHVPYPEHKTFRKKLRMKPDAVKYDNNQAFEVAKATTNLISALDTLHEHMDLDHILQLVVVNGKKHDDERG